MIIKKYDIVRGKQYTKWIGGRMNSYNKSIDHKEFEGYALVLNTSETFVHLYFPNRETRLIKKSLLELIIKF